MEIVTGFLTVNTLYLNGTEGKGFRKVTYHTTPSFPFPKVIETLWISGYSLKCKKKTGSPRYRTKIERSTKI